MSHVIVTPFSLHNILKQKLLELIDSSNLVESITTANDNITKTDFNYSENYDRNYLNLCKPYIIDCISQKFKHYNTNGLAFGNFWFQQYHENDFHDWHIHKNCHWTNIYFLELNTKSQLTQIRDLSGSLIAYEAKEGDIISFPSFLYHRSSQITDNLRKTIISFNSNFI